MNILKKKITFYWNDIMEEKSIQHNIFQDNEIEANLLISKCLLWASGILFFLLFLSHVGIITIDESVMLPIIIVGSLSLTIPAAICLHYHGEKTWIKYMLLIAFTLVLAYVDVLLTYNVSIFIITPVVFSCRYYSCRTTIRTAFFTSIVFIISYYMALPLNYNYQGAYVTSMDLNGYVHYMMLEAFLPRWLIFIAFSVFCMEISRCGRKLVLKQHESLQNEARVAMELEAAAKIQCEALPAVEDLPDHPLRRFDLAAKMYPAKEVGGDFYDFFYPDSNHLALIIADVADKGIAASLYMMMAKTLLNSGVAQTLSPGKVLENVNKQLYAKSPKGMFVTVWLGILDLTTGDMVYANAGHEHPILGRKNDDFKLLKEKHGFVLGGLDSMKYRDSSVRLEEGDTLFVYTDGAVEANDENGQMFGIERLLKSLNRRKNNNMDSSQSREKDHDMNSLLNGLKSDIDQFVGDTPQFDDLTMLAIQLRELKESIGIQVKATLEEMDTVQEYIKTTIQEAHITDLQVQKIAVAVDEIFSNIVNHNQASCIHVTSKMENEQIIITFKDDGAPFDPLAMELPDCPDPRKLGGLGIFLAKELMNDLTYEYKNDMNQLTMILNTICIN